MNAALVVKPRLVINALVEHNFTVGLSGFTKELYNISDVNVEEAEEKTRKEIDAALHDSIRKFPTCDWSI